MRGDPTIKEKDFIYMKKKLTVDGTTKRSVAWKVWQFDDAGTRGVYGGGPFNV